MPDSQEKKRRSKRPQAEVSPTDDVLRTDSDLYGDESDIPIRKKKSTKKKKNKRSSGKKKSLLRFLPFIGKKDKKPYRKKRTFFDVEQSDSNALLSHIIVYGYRIPMMALILTVIAVFGVIALFMNDTTVATVNDEITIVGLPANLQNYKILVISDLNGRRYGDKQSTLLRAINNIRYNAIFFVGDMVGSGGDPEPFYELLEGLTRKRPAYFVCGDSDPGPYVKSPRNIEGTLSQIVLEDWILGAIERGATYVDAPMSVSVGSTNVWISPTSLLNIEASSLVDTWKDQTRQEEDGTLSGLQADYDNLPITSYRYRIAQKLYSAFADMKDDDFYICLSHESPSNAFLASAASHNSETDVKYMDVPELIFSGHYCGGVWKVPFVGRPVYISTGIEERSNWFPETNIVNGTRTVGETQIYTSGGLSTTSSVLLPFRLFNQPEISLVTLTATLPESMLDE